MCHDEFADSLIQARARRNIAGGAEGKHLQGLKLEGGSSRLPPHAPAHIVDHRPPSGFTPRAVHWRLCAQYAYRFAPSPVQVQPARRATPPADNQPRLVVLRRSGFTPPPSGYETCGDGRHQPPMPVIPCSRTEAAPFATPRPGCPCRLGPDSPAGGSLRARRSYPFRQAVESSGRPMEPGVHSEPITFLSGRLPLLSAHRSTV